ncbi:alpha/beta hydrolase [Rhodococcus pyridinivorans SB3094]|uniref:Alpha/beta hydrolase n=1 Tax=Rhodococcus pyridinivorans SB3094 TaxID=1435356 RepID=V9XMR5_9NOCA|nr:alpha/beta hydrolase [Rhodococcus pyridinivorans SB3094]
MQVDDLAGWDPDALERTATELAACADAVDAVAGDVARSASFGDAWSGAAHDGAASAFASYGRDLAAQAESYRRVSACARFVVPRLRALHSELGELQTRAAARGFPLDADELLAASLRSLLVRADGLDREAAARLSVESEPPGTVLGEQGRLHTAIARSGSTTLPVLPDPATDPVQVAQWWNGLDDTARTALVAEHPERIGALDGLPAAVRDLANRALLDDERRRLESVATQLRAELDAMFLGGTVIGSLGVTGLFTDADAGLEQTVRKIEALAAIDATLAHGDRQLLALDLSGREAMAAVAVGDVDTAEHLAVFVPGAGSTVQGNLQGYDTQVAALRDAARLHLTGGDPSVAAVTWLNYQAPQWGWGLAFTERSPVSDLAARIAAPRLVDFLDGIAASRPDDPRITTVGHSYGAVVSGLALRETGAVDAAVFVGAPGIGTGDVTDLRIPPGSAYLVEAERDIVADVGTFGGDPSFLDGLTHLPAGPGTTTAGVPLAGITGHSSYLTPGTSSSHHIAGVVAGTAERSTP